MELARGTVGDKPWALTLATFARNGTSGQITLVSSSDNKRYSIALDRGVIVAARSPMVADSAARIALTSRMITSDHVAELTRRQQANPNTDDVTLLAEIAKLTLPQLRRLRAEVTLRRAARTFSVEAGQYVLEDKICLPVAGCEVDIRAVVYQGMHLHAGDERLRAELRSIAGSTSSATFALEPNAGNELHRFGFSDDEWPLLAALREGATTLPEIEVRLRAIDPRTMQAVVYALVVCGVARVISMGRTPTPPSIGRTTTPPNIDVLTGRTTTPPNIARTTTPPNIARTTTPPNVDALVGRTPTPQPVVARTTTPPNIDALAGRTPTPQPVVARAPTPPSIGRTNTPLPKATTDELASRAQTPPAVGRAPTPPPESIGVSVTFARTTTSEPSESRTTTPIGRVALAPSVGRSPTPMLSIPTSTRDLNRVSVPASTRDLEPLSATSTRDLEGLSLSTRHLERIASGRARTNPEIAADAAERARRALDVDKPELAVIELKKACELMPDNIDYSALLGWALFCAADDKRAVAPIARKALETAVAKSSQPHVARFYLGRIERMLGRDEEALGHFHAVLLMQPDHRDASAEIRVLQARMRGPRTPGL